MNKKVSYACLAFCMALYSVDGFAARKTTRAAGTTASNSRTVSTSLVSGYGDKYFKNPSITLIEKRSVLIEPLMFTNNFAKITKTMNGTNTYEPRYKLCVPCSSILLEYEVNGTLFSLTGNNGCYSFEPKETGASNYKLTVKSGAIEACGDTLRMTVNDINSAAQPEIDSVVLNLKPNSSLYDYSNIKLGQDTEIYELIDNYTEAKRNAQQICNDKSLSTLKDLKKQLAGTTATSSITTVTGGIDTALQTTSTIDAAKNGNFLDSGKTKYDTCKNACGPQKQEEIEKLDDNKKKALNECNYECAQVHKDYIDAQKTYDDCCAEEGGSCETTATSTNDEISKALAKRKSCLEKANKLSGSEKASVALSATSAAGNIVTMALSINIGSKVDGVKKALKECRDAANVMHNAGVALEAGLAEIMSAD